MSNRYQTGNRESVLKNLIKCALEDRRSLIRCYETMSGEKQAEDIAEIEIAKREIEDFIKIGKTLTSK